MRHVIRRTRSPHAPTPVRLPLERDRRCRDLSGEIRVCTSSPSVSLRVLHNSSSRLSRYAAIAVIGIVGCRDATSPDGEVALELTAASVPTEVAPPASFAIVASYWRGACAAVRQTVVRDPAGVRVTVLERAASLTPGTACPAIVYRDTTIVRVDAPYELPFTVRLDRGTLPDTVLVVRRRM